MNNDTIYPKKPGNGKAIAGLVLLIFGAILLFQQLNFLVAPWWLFRWPVILIIVGVYSGAKHNFRNTGSIIMIVIGALFLADDIFPGFDLSHFIWPLILITLGLWVILGKDKFKKSFGRKWGHHDDVANTYDYNYNYKYAAPEWDAKVNVDENGNPIEGEPQPQPNPQYAFGSKFAAGDDHLDTTSVFGSVHKSILSKDFKGGEVVNIFGGTELNFTQADINGRVYIDVTQLFGGIKIIVPPHWQVTSDMAAVFAGIDDKRRPGGIPLSPDKILVLKGTSIFAGVEIKSY
jgi:predicted membrane protein